MKNEIDFNNSQIEIYNTDDGNVLVEVTFDEDSVWLNQEQLSELFDRDRTVIGRHIRNIFNEKELEEDLVCADFSYTTLHSVLVDKSKITRTRYFNLDVIISIGYRVKSLRGTQFRQWASQRLKDYLVKGYAINQIRLEQTEKQVEILKSGIQILSRVIEQKAEADGIEWLEQYSKGLKLLDDYDHESLDQKGVTQRLTKYPTREAYQELIDQMKSAFRSDIFGLEKDHGFESAISQISKGFGEEDFYPSLEEKASMLLYLIIKNHAFTDGNKRIAAACFLLFLERNDMLFVNETEMMISNDALASLTLFVAASKPEEMDTVTRLVISVLNRNQESF